MATVDSIARRLLKRVNHANRDFDLIAGGDRVAVGLSGGIDSRTLVDLLARGLEVPGDYEIVAVHIDGTNVGLPDRTASLEPWLRELEVEHAIEPLAVPEDELLPMGCFRCSWHRRKALFYAAEALGCNKVALGHHADDAAATTLMSLMYKGRIETLAPRLVFFQGRIVVIRPLITLSEADIRRYARASGWELSSEPGCGREGSSRRLRVEQFLERFKGKEREQIRANLWRVARQAMALQQNTGAE